MHSRGMIELERNANRRSGGIRCVRLSSSCLKRPVTDFVRNMRIRHVDRGAALELSPSPQRLKIIAFKNEPTDHLARDELQSPYLRPTERATGVILFEMTDDWW